jgi:hypothetical protein
MRSPARGGTVALRSSFRPGGRGSRLEKYEVRVVTGTSEHRVSLLGSNAIAKQAPDKEINVAM